MNGKKRQDLEERLSQSFDAGLQHGETPEENSIMKDYRDIQSSVRSFSSIQYNQKILKRRIEQDSQIKKKTWKYFAAAACFAIIICGAGLLLTLSSHRTPQPILRFSFSDNSIIPAQIADELKSDLLVGKTIVVPYDETLNIELEDGTRLIGANQAILSLDFIGRRQVALSAGAIEIHASKNKDIPLVVDLPMGTVQVVGTVFHIELSDE